MNLLTSNGLKIYDRLKNINKLDDDDISKLNFDINSMKLFKQINIDENYINEINIFKPKEFYFKCEFDLYKYYMTLCNKIYNETNLKKRCILLFMAFLDTINKFHYYTNNFNLLPTYNSDIKIFAGNSWIISYIYSKHNEILRNELITYYTFKYYLEIILKNPKIDNVNDLCNKLFKKGKHIKKIEDIKNKSGILIYANVEFKDLKDKILNDKYFIGQAVYINKDMFDPNFKISLILPYLINLHKNKKMCYWFIED